MKIGYFVPEFPGQTHIYFWRELQELRRLGVEAEVVSTRRPPPEIVCHSWAKEAMAQTAYLFPPTKDQLLGTARAWTRSRPSGWKQAALSYARAEGLDLKGRLRLPVLAAMAGQLSQLAKDRGWQHVHVHLTADAAHVAMFARLLFGLPYSLTLHGQFSDNGPNQREKWRHASFAIIITEHLKKMVEPELQGCMPQHLAIAPMGVDPDQLRRSAPYQPWSGEGPLRIFCCGRLNPAKRQEDVIEAAVLLKQRGINAEVTLAGEDADRGQGHRKILEALAAERGVQSSVRFLGAVAEERIREELERTHLFTLPSVFEPLGIATIEAMAMKVPVVVTAVGGVPEFVEQGKEGILIQPRDPGALADAAERIARNPDLARAMGEAGRQRVERQFHSRRSAEVMHSLLRATLGSKAA